MTQESTETQAEIEDSDSKKPEKPKEAETSIVLSGAEKSLDGGTHIGIAVLVESDGGLSTLMIPDVTTVKENGPVYITKPIRINGGKLKEFLKEKLPTAKALDPILDLIEDVCISCEAFYYTKDGPLLMMFALKFDKGLIKTLTGDEALGSLFDIKGASVRVLRCPGGSFDVLKRYAAELSG